MPIYKILKSELGNEIIEITEENGTIRYIPIDKDNSDYQRYLRWLENPEADQFTPIVKPSGD